MKIEISADILKDPQQSLALEWLDTNGLGGWSGSSIIGANTRNYHGTLVAATRAPTERKVMLSRLDESLLINDKNLALSARDFGDAIYPQGYMHLFAFSQGICPVWDYLIGSVRLRKSLCCIHGHNIVCIKYELLCGADEIKILFEPFIAARDYHTTRSCHSLINNSYSISSHVIRFEPDQALPAISLNGPWDGYQHNPEWHYRFYYREENKRGLNDREDLLCTGKIVGSLRADTPLILSVCCEESVSQQPEDLFNSEINRRESFTVNLKRSAGSDRKNSVNPEIYEFFTALLKASDQFIVKRGISKTIIAGYPWFTDWGRDTLIAMRGLCLATGRFQESRMILETFCDNIRDGLVPNRFTDNGDEAEYNTVDAALWLFIAAYEFFLTSADDKFVKNILLPKLVSVFQEYCKGTHYNIKEDSDGLLHAGNNHIQLTWMDAKIGNWVVTPRHGKAVEINALWYNALRILEILCRNYSRIDLADELKKKAAITESSFSRLFWNESADCLYDVISDSARDDSIRPNQIFAIGLPFPAIKSAKALAIFNTVTRELLTPRGLRTLSVSNPSYRGRYCGSGQERDSAYHQGTVWPWLLGSYVDALYNCKPESAHQETVRIVKEFIPHLREAGIGSVSEIFDGDPPHAAAGTIAQAWSVGELIRICKRVL